MSPSVDDLLRVLVGLDPAPSLDAIVKALGGPADDLIIQAQQENLVEGWEAAGGRAEDSLEYCMVNAYLSRSPLMAAARRARCAEIRAELLGANPTALDRLLVDRVVLNWLDLYLNQIKANVTKAESLKMIEWRDRRIERAERRYLASIKALASVRKFKLVAVQVNFASGGGNQQVNVGSAP